MKIDSSCAYLRLYFQTFPNGRSIADGSTQASQTNWSNRGKLSRLKESTRLAAKHLHPIRAADKWRHAATSAASNCCFQSTEAACGPAVCAPCGRRRVVGGESWAGPDGARLGLTICQALVRARLQLLNSTSMSLRLQSDRLASVSSTFLSSRSKQA